MFPTDAATEYFTDTVVLARINAEVDTATAKKFAISGYPTMVLIRPDGSEIDRIIGYLEIDDLIQTVDNYQKGIGTLDDLLHRMETSPDRDMALEIADKYKYSGRPEKATQWFNRVITMGKATDSLSGEARSEEANMHYRAKEYDDALSEYANIAQDFSSSSFGRDALIWQGLIYMSMDKNQDAIARFENYLKKYPDSEDADYVKDKLKTLQADGNKN